METVNYELVKGEIDYDMLLFSQFYDEVICSYPLTLLPHQTILFFFSHYESIAYSRLFPPPLYLKPLTNCLFVLFVVEDHKNDEPDRCYNCHPNHEFEHTLTPHF